jgi:hypothetical protein
MFKFKFGNIKIRKTSPVYKLMQQKIKKLCIKDEIKFLCIKKKKLSRHLLKTQLVAANKWRNIWNIIENNIIVTINTDMQRRYKITEKFKRLQNK